MNKLNTKKENIKKYLIFRNNLEKELDKTKLKIKNDIKEYKDNIHKLNNVSLQKINYYISLFKSKFLSSDINKLCDTIFEFMLDSFEYNKAVENYKAHEKIIKEYISVNISLQIELKNHRNKIREDIKNYRTENKGQFNFNAAENAFVEMRRNIKNISECSYLEDLKISREVVDELIKISDEYIENTKSKENIAKLENNNVKKPKKKITYKMTEAEILQMMFGNKEIAETIRHI